MQSVILRPQQNILHRSWQMNNMSIGEVVKSPNVNSDVFVDNPTDTDVLLGRGVGINRHVGNTNFRQMVSQWVVSSILSM
jgi:hypothetical protein